MSDPTSLIAQIRARSDRKLRTPKNLAKGTWQTMTDDEILLRMHDELAELLVEMTRPAGDGLYSIDWDAIADEAADLYHFACMGADPGRADNRQVSVHS